MFKIEKIKSKINHVRPIKSTYILNEIFSFLNMKQKLNIIIYNKQLQKEQGIDIEDYKSISGKYKIDGIFGLGREYKIKTNEMEKEMVMEKNIMTMKKLNLKVNIKMDKRTEMEKNIIIQLIVN